MYPARRTIMQSASKRNASAAKDWSSRDKVWAPRERLRAQGLRPIYICVSVTRKIA